MIDWKRWKESVIVASGTVMFDYFGHFYLTHPMELPTYFVAKWLGAFLATMVILNYDFSKVLNRRVDPAVGGGVLFALWAGLYYQYLAPIIGLPIIGPPGSIAFLGITGAANYPLWALLHFGAYYAAYKLLKNWLR